MGFIITAAIIILVLCAIKVPKHSSNSSGEMTEERRRELIKKGQRSFRDDKPGGLPWFGKRKRAGKKNDSFWGV